MRNLAQRSATSAKEIKDLINDSVLKVEAGTELVNASGRTLTEIVDGVAKMTAIVAEIAAASREQSAGIEQVNQAVMQMDDLTQQNASLVEEAAQTSRTLELESKGLIQMMDFFQMARAQGARGVVPRVRPSTGATSPAPAKVARPRREAAMEEVPAALLAQGRRSSGASSEWSQF